MAKIKPQEILSCQNKGTLKQCNAMANKMRYKHGKDENEP